MTLFPPYEELQQSLHRSNSRNKLQSEELIAAKEEIERLQHLDCDYIHRLGSLCVKCGWFVASAEDQLDARRHRVLAACNTWTAHLGPVYGGTDERWFQFHDDSECQAVINPTHTDLNDFADWLIAREDGEL